MWNTSLPKYFVAHLSGNSSAEEIWSRRIGQGDGNIENMPAYQALKREGLDTCGLAQLASRTVGVPFVGAIAACQVVSELLRRLNGGQAYELLSHSALAIEDVEGVPAASKPYAYGHVMARVPPKQSSPYPCR